MSRKGRKRKSIQREQNGRAQRPTTTSERKRMTDLRAVVLAQPHRIGPHGKDQRMQTPYGRLILTGAVSHPSIHPDELIRAADLYLKAQANFRWAVDSRRGLSTMVGRGGEPTGAEAAAFVDAWRRVSRAVRDAGERADKAADAAILHHQPEDWIAPHWIKHYLVEALVALVAHYGLATGQRKAS